MWTEPGTTRRGLLGHASRGRVLQKRPTKDGVHHVDHGKLVKLFDERFVLIHPGADIGRLLQHLSHDGRYHHPECQFQKHIADSRLKTIIRFHSAVHKQEKRR